MEVINSFFSNIKDKFTNPFFGTLILVLVIHHWKLWYATFNFDGNSNLEDRINFIENYISLNLSFSSFLWDVIQAIVFMFLGYGIVLGTRSLVLWIEFGLMPAITGKIVNKNVVRRSDYEEVVKEREKYFDQYEEQRKNVRNFSQTIDEQNEQIKQKDKDLLEQSATISSTLKKLDITKIELEKVQQKSQEKASNLLQIKRNLNELQTENERTIERLDKFKNLFLGSENQDFYTSSEKFPPEILRKVQELKRENKWKLFLAVGNFFHYGGSIGGEAITEMIERGLAFDRDNREELTPVGQIIWNYRKILDTEDEYAVF